MVFLCGGIADRFKAGQPKFTLHALRGGVVGSTSSGLPDNQSRIINHLVEEFGTDLLVEMRFMEETCWHNWITVSLFLCAHTLSLMKAPHLAVMPLHGDRN